VERLAAAAAAVGVRLTTSAAICFLFYSKTSSLALSTGRPSALRKLPEREPGHIW